MDKQPSDYTTFGWNLTVLGIIFACLLANAFPLLPPSVSRTMATEGKYFNRLEPDTSPTASRHAIIYTNATGIG